MSQAAKARSLELFFVDGNPDGMLTATVPFQWSGHMLFSARTQLREALKRPETSRPGVYLLVGGDEGRPLLYIGEGDDISQRIKSHDAKKDWWSTVVFITSIGDQLNKAHARYLESRLIEKAKQVNKVDLENEISPSVPKLSEAAVAHMDDFLDHIYLVLPALKIDFFLESTRGVFNVKSDEDILDHTIFELFVPNSDEKVTAYLDGGSFVVEAGSKTREEWVGQPPAGDLSKRNGYKKLYDNLVEQGVLVREGDHCVF